MMPYYEDSHVKLLCGDATTMLGTLPTGSVHCVVTSPPYWSLRDYHVDGQIGLEPTIELYVGRIVQVFQAVRRILRDDGLCFVNLGDSYAGSGNGSNDHRAAGASLSKGDEKYQGQKTGIVAGLKPLDLCNIPHRVAQALQADGWYWRDAWHWVKRSPMPESLSGTRWERHRVKVAASARGSGYHAEAFEDEPQGARDGREFANHAGEWQPCPGCAACTYQDQPQRNGYVLRRGSWRYTSAVEYVFMFCKAPGYTAFQGQVRQDLAESTLHDKRNGTGRHTQGEVHGTKYTNDESDGAAQPSWYRAKAFVNPESGRNPRNYGFLSSEPMDVQRCAGCGRVYLGPELKRLPKTEVEIEDDDGGTTVKVVRRCKDCGSWEWTSHFAAFPQDLVEPFIRVATSDRGVCSTCGSQWVPVVEKSPAYQAIVDSAHNTEWYSNKDRDIKNGKTNSAMPEIKVLDYWPTCSCAAGASAPCVVLDPFCGTGTTMLAARKLGRRSIGIDLSGPYLDIAVRRLGDLRKSQMEMMV